MTDLSDSSGEWWELVVSEARAWYKQYIKLRPIQRASSKIEPSAELQKPKWARVEKRAISMLLSSVPTTVKEELVATRTLSPLGLVSKLMVLVYQPGGAHERTIILRQLEDPPEAGSPSEACMGLRRWMRWLRRATDIGLNLPDAIILMKGINKLSKRILTQQPDLQFRCSLVKNTLQLDTIPTEETVRTYAEHLLAELEQLMHRVRPSSSTTRPGNQGGGPPAVKALHGEGKEKKGDSPTDGCKRSLPILPHGVWMSKRTVVQMGASTGDWGEAEPGEEVLHLQGHATSGSGMSEERDGEEGGGISGWSEAQAPEAVGQNWWWKWDFTK